MQAVRRHHARRAQDQPSDEAQPPGGLMQFAVDMRKACLFDPASEQLI